MICSPTASEDVSFITHGRHPGSFPWYISCSFSTNLTNEVQFISHVNDPYYANTENKGACSVTKDQGQAKMTKALRKICNLFSPLTCWVGETDPGLCLHIAHLSVLASNPPIFMYKLSNMSTVLLTKGNDVTSQVIFSICLINHQEIQQSVS